MTLYTQQDKNIQRTWLLMSTFFILIIGLGWLISYLYNDQFILVIAVVFSVGSSITSYWFSDKIALGLAAARPITEEANRPLYHLVENLCITAGLPMPRIYVINDPSPNAFATGRNANHAVIAVTQGLLDKLDKVELEGVIAHELSHIGNKDMLLMTVAVVLTGIVTIVADIFLRGGFRGRGSSNDRAGGVLAIVGIILILLSPLFATLLQLSISRKREFLADASGSLLTRYPEGLARALEKISADPAQLQQVSKATAHLFIANPFKAKKLSKLFMTHPPIEERIAALRGMDIKE